MTEMTGLSVIFNFLWKKVAVFCILFFCDRIKKYFKDIHKLSYSKLLNYY